MVKKLFFARSNALVEIQIFFFRTRGTYGSHGPHVKLFPYVYVYEKQIFFENVWKGVTRNLLTPKKDAVTKIGWKTLI